MGVHRHAAEHVGGGDRRHPRRDADRHPGAAHAVRSRRHQGDHGSRPPAPPALCGRDQRRAAAARQHRVAVRARGALGAHQPQRAGLVRPDHPAQQLFAGAGGRRGRRRIRLRLRSGERDRRRCGRHRQVGEGDPRPLCRHRDAPRGGVGGLSSGVIPGRAGARARNPSHRVLHELPAGAMDSGAPRCARPRNDDAQ